MRLLLTVALLLSALLPSAYFFWQARDAPHLGQFQDDALYLVGAKSMAEGHGYKILSLPGEPYQTKYPPLYPALQAIVWKLDSAFPSNLPWIMLLQWFIWLAYLAATFAVIWAMPPLERRTKIAAVVFLAVAPAFVYLSLCLLAETLVSAFVLLTLLLAAMSDRPTLRAAFLAGLTASAAFLTKTAALPLLVAVAVGLAWRKQYRQAMLFCLAPLTAIAAWTAWASAHRIQTSDVNLMYYIDYIGFYRHTIPLAKLPRVVMANLSVMVESLGRLVLFFPNAEGPLKLLLILAGLGLVWGAVVLLRSLRSPALSLFAILYTGECLLWNYQPNERLLFPLLFLFVGGFFHGMAGVVQKTARAATARRLYAVCAVLFIGWSLVATCRYAPDFLSMVRRTRDRVACVSRWLADSVPAGDQVMAYHDVDLFFFSGRHSVRMAPLPLPYYLSDREAAEQILLRMPVYASQMQMTHLFWDPDDYHDFSFLKDPRRRDEILGRLPGLVLESDVCGARIYKFTQP